MNLNPFRIFTGLSDRKFFHWGGSLLLTMSLFSYILSWAEDIEMKILGGGMSGLFAALGVLLTSEKVDFRRPLSKDGSVRAAQHSAIAFSMTFGLGLIMVSGIFYLNLLANGPGLLVIAFSLYQIISTDIPAEKRITEPAFPSVTPEMIKAHREAPALHYQEIEEPVRPKVIMKKVRLKGRREHVRPSDARYIELPVIRHEAVLKNTAELAAEDILSMYSVEEDWAENPKQLFCLKIKGSQILPARGDAENLVAIRKDPKAAAKCGQMVMALTDNGLIFGILTLDGGDFVLISSDQKRRTPIFEKQIIGTVEWAKQA